MLKRFLRIPKWSHFIKAVHIDLRQQQLQSALLKAQIYLHDFTDRRVSMCQWPDLSAVLWAALKALGENDLMEAKIPRVSQRGQHAAARLQFTCICRQHQETLRKNISRKQLMQFLISHVAPLRSINHFSMKLPLSTFSAQFAWIFCTSVFKLEEWEDSLRLCIFNVTFAAFKSISEGVL